jgi:hypothetical protein
MRMVSQTKSSAVMVFEEFGIFGEDRAFVGRVAVGFESPPSNLGALDHSAQAVAHAGNFRAIAFGHYREKFMILPAAEIVGRAEAAFECLPSDAQHGGNGAISVARLDFEQMIESDAQNAEGDTALHVCG